MRHSRSVVWRTPRNDLWNNTYVCVLTNLGSVVCKCGSVLANDDGGFENCSAHNQWKSVLSCQRVPAVVKLDMKSRSVDCAIQSGAIAARLDISRRCAGNVRSQLASQVPRAAVTRDSGKGDTAATPTSAIVVDSSVIEDLIVLVEMRTAVVVVNEDI